VIIVANISSNLNKLYGDQMIVDNRINMLKEELRKKEKNKKGEMEAIFATKSILHDIFLKKLN